MARRQRLGIQDAFWLEMDKPGNLMVVDSLLWTAAPIDWDSFRKIIRERLWDRYPAFRSVPERGTDGDWYWVERPDDDLDNHLEHVLLPEPGDDAALQDFIAFERAVPLGRDVPMWQQFLIDGYRGGSAVVMRAHHALADGIRMVELTLSIGDASPDGGALVPAASGAPARRATAAATLEQLARESWRNPLGAARTARERVAGALAALPGDVDIVRKLVLGTRNEATCWTGGAGTRKAVSWSAPLPLAEVKDVAHAHEATVNDVLVSCVAGSLRAYLQSHRARCSSVTWDVPVNLKPLDATLPDELGNSFAIVQLELPTDIADPRAELAVVKRRMARIKQGHEAPIAFAVQAGLSRLNRRLYRALVDLLADRAVGVLTNVPGPQQPIYLAGERVAGAMGWAPLSGDQAMSFTIFSYDANVFVGIACDVTLVPDHRQIVDGFGAAFRRLAALSC